MKYWTKEDMISWNEWKDKPKEELLNIIFKIVARNIFYAEDETILQACKKQLGLKYKIPNAYSKKYLIESGLPKNELLEAQV